MSSSGFSLSWSVTCPCVRLSRMFLLSCASILPSRFLPGRALTLFFTSWNQRVTPPAHFRSFVHSTSLFPLVATSFLLYSGSWNFLCTRAANSVCSSSSVQFKFLILLARALQRLFTQDFICNFNITRFNGHTMCVALLKCRVGCT